MQNASVQAKPIEMVAIAKLMRLGFNGDQLAKVSIEAINSLQPLQSSIHPHPTREGKLCILHVCLIGIWPHENGAVARYTVERACMEQ